jgi:hypothetical protein
MTTLNQVANFPVFKGKNVRSVTPVTLSNGKQGYHVTYTEDEQAQTPGNAGQSVGRIAGKTSGNAGRTVTRIAGMTAKATGKAALWTGKTVLKALWSLVPGKNNLATAWKTWIPNALWISAVIYITWQIAARI